MITSFGDRRTEALSTIPSFEISKEQRELPFGWSRCSLQPPGSRMSGFSESAWRRRVEISGCSSIRLNPQWRVILQEIVHNHRRVSADTALRLGLFFGTTPEHWMHLQTRYDLTMARRSLTAETAERIAARRGA